jgi:hypothetical protein
MRGPDLLELSYERSLHGRGRRFPGVPVGRFAGRLVSWLSNTTTMRSRLPDERALTWLALNLEKLGPALEKLGPAALARAIEPADQPVIAVTPSAVTPSNEAALRGVKDILVSPFRLAGFRDVTEPYFRVIAPVPRLDQGRISGALSQTAAPQSSDFAEPLQG